MEEFSKVNRRQEEDMRIRRCLEIVINEKSNEADYMKTFVQANTHW